MEMLISIKLLFADTLAKDMEYHEIQQVEKTKAKKPKTPPKRSAVAARQSPKGRGGRRTASSRSRSRYIDFGELDSSDSDVHERAPRSTYDPNTIVLDCDDEFFGGPAVNVTRNLAAATAVSTDESMELTVSVNINGKIEKYQMNSVRRHRFINKIVSNFRQIVFLFCFHLHSTRRYQC